VPNSRSASSPRWSRHITTNEKSSIRAIRLPRIVSAMSVSEPPTIPIAMNIMRIPVSASRANSIELSSARCSGGTRGFLAMTWPGAVATIFPACTDGSYLIRCRQGQHRNVGMLDLATERLLELVNAPVGLGKAEARIETQCQLDEYHPARASRAHPR